MTYRKMLRALLNHYRSVTDPLAIYRSKGDRIYALSSDLHVKPASIYNWLRKTYRPSEENRVAIKTLYLHKVIDKRQSQS